jgi:hypothetical protein
MRDRARPPETPAPIAPLLIVTRRGRDYRPGPRQRIEQVARQGSTRSPRPEFSEQISDIKMRLLSHLLGDHGVIAAHVGKPFMAIDAGVA